MFQESWRALKIFGNEARVHILNLLLNTEMASLSDILRALQKRGVEITISGTFKHMRVLEKAGLVRRESGGLKLEEPDARRTIYMLEGRERIQRILKLEQLVSELLRTSSIFKRTADTARKVQGIGPGYADERKRLELWLDTLEKEVEVKNLTKDEREKMELWKIITKYAT